MIETEAPSRVAPSEPTTPIRPSEAIRLGMLVRPVAGRVEMFQGDDIACALGAMAIGFGFAPNRENRLSGYATVEARLPQTLEPPCGCVTGKASDSWSSTAVIYHLNDQHGWARECIAEWLRQEGL
jgi:hypothetical protein